VRDVVFLVADQAMEQMVRGFFGKEKFHLSLRCGEFDFDPSRDIVRGMGDGWVHKYAGEALSQHRDTHRRVVVMLDSGLSWSPSPPDEQIEADIIAQIEPFWPPERHVAILIEPELDVWLWHRGAASLPHALGITSRLDKDLYEILRENGYWPDGARKPPDPKAAREFLQRPPYRADKSSAVFRRVAERLSVRHCDDKAFLKLRDTLREWFPCA
jgi:hypothetical protein